MTSTTDTPERPKALNAPGGTSLFDAAASLDGYWSPRVLGRVNDHYIKVARLIGQLAWHAHENEDELFLVLKGQLTIQYEEGEVVLKEGDFHVVPKGKPHNPRADAECWIALIEPMRTKHTGDVLVPGTRTIEEQLGRNGPDLVSEASTPGSI